METGKKVIELSHGYAVVEDVPVPKGREIAENWTSEMVTEYDDEGHTVRTFWRSRMKD